MVEESLFICASSKWLCRSRCSIWYSNTVVRLHWLRILVTLQPFFSQVLMLLNGFLLMTSVYYNHTKTVIVSWRNIFVEQLWIHTFFSYGKGLLNLLLLIGKACSSLLWLQLLRIDCHHHYRRVVRSSATVFFAGGVSWLGSQSNEAILLLRSYLFSLIVGLEYVDKSAVINSILINSQACRSLIFTEQNCLEIVKAGWTCGIFNSWWHDSIAKSCCLAAPSWNHWRLLYLWEKLVGLSTITI